MHLCYGLNPLDSVWGKEADRKKEFRALKEFFGCICLVCSTWDNNVLPFSRILGAAYYTSPSFGPVLQPGMGLELSFSQKAPSYDLPCKSSLISVILIFLELMREHQVSNLKGTSLEKKVNKSKVSGQPTSRECIP